MQKGSISLLRRIVSQRQATFSQITKQLSAAQAMRKAPVSVQVPQDQKIQNQISQNETNDMNLQNQPFEQKDFNTMQQTTSQDFGLPETTIEASQLTASQMIEQQQIEESLEKTDQKSVFQNDSTFLLIKKLFVYKLMGSDMFINHSLWMINLSYKIFGVKMVNFAINHSVGSIFTSGETFKSLVDDVLDLKKKNIHGIGMYSVEGLQSMDYSQINKFYKELMDSIDALSQENQKGHVALKMSVFITMDILQRLNIGQTIFVDDILKFNKQDQIDISDLRNSIQERGITCSEEEIQMLFESLKFDHNISDQVSRLEIYSNGHLFSVQPPQNETERNLQNLKTKIALGCGAGITFEDLQYLQKFSEQILNITKHAHQKGCDIYVDAEQSFVQNQIASFAQQLTQIFNRGEKHTIMTGYQCYLKKQTETIQFEVAASKVLGYNIGIKLIRGAYIREERELAEKNGYESPCWDSIEETHKCYNESASHIIPNLSKNCMLMIASHNVDSVELAKNMRKDLGIADNRITFAQLKAFSDNVTGQLASENLLVYKYLPYGPMEQMMPYLLRRGQESKQVCREQVYQNQFLKKEILNRLNIFSRK